MAEAAATQLSDPTVLQIRLWTLREIKHKQHCVPLLFPSAARMAADACDCCLAELNCKAQTDIVVVELQVCLLNVSMVTHHWKSCKCCDEHLPPKSTPRYVIISMWHVENHTDTT